MRILSGTLLAATLATAMPAPAAPLDRQYGGTRAGAFAGTRVRLSFGGPSAAVPQAGLVIAPTFARGETTGFHHVYGAGFEFGFAGRDPHFSAGGHKLWSGGATRQPDGERLGLSSLGTAGLVLGGAALIGGAILVAQVAEGNRNSD